MIPAAARPTAPRVRAKAPTAAAAIPTIPKRVPTRRAGPGSTRRIRCAATASSNRTKSATTRTTEDDDACNNACELPCGLEWSATHLGPTQESDVYGLHVGVDADGGVVAIGFQREVTVDPKGKSTIGEPTALVVAFDPEGAERWTQVLAQTDLSVQPGDVAVAADGLIYVAMSNELAGRRDGT